MADKKFLDANGLKKVKEDYEKKIGVKVDKVEGSQLVETADVTKLKGLENIKEVQVNGQKLTVGDDGIVNIDVQGVIDGDGLATDTEVDTKLQDYTKTENLADDPGLVGKFLDKETAQSTYANKEDIHKIQIPTCTQEELEEKKATAVDGDRVVVTDEEYHIYIYIGETGTGEWKDTGTHINLSDYVQKDGDKVLIDPKSVTQIETNKTDIASLKTDKADTTTVTEGLAAKADKTELPEAMSDEDIEAILNPVV